MTEFLTIHEIVKAARQNLSQGVWDYLTGGADTETTLLRNRQGLESIAFRPRVLRNVKEIDLTATFMGDKMRLPVALAPMGSLDSMEAGGSVSVAKAAEEFGVTSFLSSVTRPGLEDVVEGRPVARVDRRRVGDQHPSNQRFVAKVLQESVVDPARQGPCLLVSSPGLRKPRSERVGG